MKRYAAGLAMAAVAMLGFWLTGCQDPVDKLKSSEPSQVLDGLREVAKRGRPEDVEQIAGVVAHQDERVASEAIRTLGEVRGTEAAQVLSQVAQDDGRAAIRASAAMQLGRLEDVASVDVVRNLIRTDPDPSVREAAIASLQRIQSLGAVAFLVEVAETETDVIVQRRAVEVVEGLIGVKFSYNPKASAEVRAARYLWTVTVTSVWARSVRSGPNTWHFMIEDMGDTGGGDLDYADIDVEVTYDNGLPTQVKIIQGKKGSQTYGYDLTINGVVVVTRIDDHQGLIVKLVSSPDGVAPPASGITRGTPGGSTSGTGSDGSWSFLILGPTTSEPLKPSNYGLNKGTYDVANLNITKPDAKLIYILDHHELVADAFDGNFDKYFIDIKNLTSWNNKWAQDGADWREYQSLRHFSQANVLFCDGHIESLGHWDLDPQNPAARSLWRALGN